MAAAAAPPSSSPRLPSPPPFTEVQIGPKSPTVGEGFGSAGEKLFGVVLESDDGSTRRIRPGTKAADMASGPPLVPLSQVNLGWNKTNAWLALIVSFSLILLSSYKNISKHYIKVTRSLWALRPSAL